MKFVNFAADVGFGFLIIDALMFLYILLCAVINGFSVNVDFNHYGEGWFELGINILSLPFMAFYVYHRLQNGFSAKERGTK